MATSARRRSNLVARLWSHPWAPPALGALLSLPAVWWLLAMDYFRSHDADIHRWRIWEFWQVWRSGVAPARWAPDPNYGFGSPLFAYYGPLPYYLGGVAQAWGVGAAVAAKLVFGLGLALAAAGTYLLAGELYRGRSGARWAALLAASAYLYAPYVLANVSLRGAIGETLALGIAPWVLYLELRALHSGGVHRHVALAFGAASLVLAHNLTALILAPVAATLAVCWLASHRTAWRQRALAVCALGLSAALALALSAFYWLPTVGELGYVHIERARGSQFGPKYASAFVDPTDLVQLAPIHDYRADFGAEALHPHLGLAQVAVVAACVAVTAWRWRRSRRWVESLLLLGAAAAVYLATSPSRWLWDGAPLLANLQFPWRFFGLASLLGALATASLAATRRGAPALATLLGVGLLVAGAWVYVTPGEWRAEWDTAANLREYERQSQAVGLTHDEEFLPAAVTRSRWNLFDPPRSTEGTLAAPPDEVRLLDAQPTRWRLEVRSARESTVALDVFYFPTWRASVDGVTAAARPATGLGLLAVDVPPGTHVVEVRQEPTRLQRVADLASAAGLVVALVAVVGTCIRAGSRQRLAAALVALGIMGGLAPFVVAAANPVRPPEYASASAVPESNEPLRLLGARLDQSRLASSGQVELALFAFVSRAVPSSSPSVTARLAGPDGATVTTSAHPLGQGTRPATIWQPGLLLTDRFELALPPGSPAGRYTLYAGVGAPEREVAAFELGAAGWAPHTAEQPPSFLAWPSVQWDGYLALDWAEFEPEGPDGGRLATLGAGQRATLRGTLAWSRLSPEDPGSEAVLRLVDAQHAIRQEVRSPIRFAPNATTLKVPVQVDVPPDLPPGRYRLELGVRDAAGNWLRGRTRQDPETYLSRVVLRVDDVRPACDCLPGGAAESGVELGDGIRALGYERRVDEGTVEVVVYWQARQTPKGSYSAFVHLLDRDGRVVDQFDGIPYDGGLPTAAWQPGQVVPFAARLRLPDQGGPFRLRTGLYESVGLKPLKAADGRSELGLGLVERARPLAGAAVAFEGGVELLGHRLEVAPGQSVLTLYWRASRQVGDDYSVFVHVLDSTGRVVAQGDGPPELGERGSREWPPGATIVDPHPIALPPARPLRIEVGLYRLADGGRLRLVGGGDTVSLGEITAR